VFVQNQTLPSLGGPVRSIVTPVASHPHSTQYPLNNPSTANSSWKSSITPGITPVVPVLPAPIVIAPIDAPLDPVAIQALDPLRVLSHFEATGGHVKAPASAMTTEAHGRVPRPITGRGFRDQLTATTTADTKVSFCLCS